MMFTLVLGGSASGKSEYAERLLVSGSSVPRVYIATMQPFDAECRCRIAKHQRQRAERQFTTVECYTRLADVTVPTGSGVLLECMSNLAANELYSPDGAGTAEKAFSSILGGVEHLLSRCQTLVIVSNEIFTGGNDYADDTDRYLHLLADLNKALAARADCVCEVVCGLPIYYKGNFDETL